MPNLTDYRVFPRHIGQWEGLVKVLDADLQESRRYRIRQQFKAKANQWGITNTYIFGDGTSMTHSFDVIPLGEGTATVTTAVPYLEGRSMEAMECGADVINFKIINTETGRIQEMETVTLIGEDSRFRTAQLFDRDGTFKGLLVIAEQRQECIA